MQDTKKSLELVYSSSIEDRLKLCDSVSYNSQLQRIEIPYFTLKDRPSNIGKGISFVRFRNYKEGFPKYASPSKKEAGDYHTPLYYPKQLIQDFNSKSLSKYSNTIVLTEGEFKAITATLCNLACVSFAGITLHAHFVEHHQREFVQLVEAIKHRVVNVVLLYDADGVSITAKDGSLTNKRLLDFQQSANQFFKILSDLPTKKKLQLFVGHIQHEQKGLDDLLNSLSYNDRKECVRQLKNPNEKAKGVAYFNLLKLNKSNYKKQLNKLFPCRKIEQFIKAHKEELNKEYFTFYHTSEHHKRRYPIGYKLEDAERGILWAESSYYNSFNDSINKVTTSSEYIKYLSENAQDIRKAIKAKGKVLVQAPTGAGKTRLVEELKNSWERVILLVPTRAIAKQQINYTLYIGGERVSDNVIETTDIVSTFAKIKQGDLINQHDFDDSLLVIDEAHEMYKSFNYRADECCMLELVTKQFKHSLCLSATPCLPFFYGLGFSLMSYTQSLPKTKILDIRLYSDRTNKNGSVSYNKLIKDIISESRKNDRKAYIFHLSKDNHIIKEIHDNDPNTMLLTGDTSRNKYKDKFDTILKNECAFIGGYDTLLVNSVLESGASFQDTNIDIYIIGSTDESQIIQALSRFRKLEGNRFILYTRKKDYQNFYNEPKDNLKELEHECNLSKYNFFGNGDIKSSLDAEIKTYKNDFSLVKTFSSYEQIRVSSQSTWQMLGHLVKSTQIEIGSIREIEPARAVTEKEVKELESDFLIQGKLVHEKIVSSAIKSIKDKRTLGSLSKFGKGFKYFFSMEAKSEQWTIKDNEKKLLKLIIYCKDLAIKLDLPSENLYTFLDALLQYFDNDIKDYKLIESIILFNVLFARQQDIDKLSNKGKAIEFAQLIELAKSKASRITINDLKANKYFKRLSRNKRAFYLKVLAISDKVKQIIKDSHTMQKTIEHTGNRNVFDVPYSSIRKKKTSFDVATAGGT